MTSSEAFSEGLVHHKAGRLREAEALYRLVLAAEPDHTGALRFLGVLAHQAGNHSLALRLIQRAIALNANDAGAHSNLGVVYSATGQWEEAATSFQRAIQLRSNEPNAYYNLGNVFRDRGQHEQAIGAYSRALELDPAYPDAHLNLGNALAALGRTDEAIRVYRRALEIRPEHAEVQSNLGNVLMEAGRCEEAIAAYEQALRWKPQQPEIYNNLGNALKDQGRLDEGLAAYRRALSIDPRQAEIHSNVVYGLHLHPEENRASIAEEQRRWNQQFCTPYPPSVHPNDRTPDRRLRVGYVSPDFRMHALGWNLWPLIRSHDRSQFEIFCYSGVAKSDAMTAQFERHADHWRRTVAITDNAVAAMIREDGIDILVDLTLHSGSNRLPVFARRPAPVQLSFGGYPESAGIEAIPWRISDRYLESDSTNAGERVHLIDSFWCYDPCGIEMEANELPALETGRITFGCLNNFSKINEPTLQLWARVLREVGDSRLILQTSADGARERTREILADAGIDRQRVEFVGRYPHGEYFGLYHRLDLVLDSFPYNGHTTNLDALWMGVPVMSLAGESPVNRGGLSQLSHLGLEELVAFSPEAFVASAIRLAGDLPTLAHLRAALRARMQASLLMDAPRFADQIETAYRRMWRQWCVQAVPPPPDHGGKKRSGVRDEGGES